MADEQQKQRIGQNIKSLMRERGMTQRELAQAANLAERSVSNYVNGKRVPSVVVSLRICKALGCTFDDILKGVCSATCEVSEVLSEVECGVTKKLRKMLTERGIDWRDDGRFHVTHWALGNRHFRAFEQDGKLYVQISIGPLNVERAIAATVGDGEGTRDEWRSVALGLFDALEKADLETSWQWIGENTLLREEIGYGDAEAATVGVRDTIELWPEWEQALFANVTDEVAQDNLNECVHELLDKAATVGVSTDA